MQLQRAEELLSGQQATLGVAYLSRMLRSNPSNQVAAARLAAAIQRPFAMPVSEPLRHETAGPVNSPGSAQFSADGLRVVTSCGDTARVWDVRSGRPLTAPLPHEKEIRMTQFSPDGLLVITASEDHTARIWDARTGRPLGHPFRHTKAVLSAQFSPDSTRVVTSSEDQTARVWDTATGQPVSEALEHPGAVVSARSSSDGTRVITASGEGIFRQWDIRSSRPVVESTAHAGPILSAEFSEDGSRAVTIGARLSSRAHEGIELENVQAAWVWNIVAGQPLAQPLQHGAAVTVARMSRDGLRVLTAAGNVARVWDAYTGRLLTDQLRHEDLIVDAEFSPDGLRVVTASKDGTARVWDAQTGQSLVEPIWHDGNVTLARFSPDGAVLVTAAWDKTFRLWNVRKVGPLAQRLQLEASVRWAEFSPDGSRVLTVDRSSARIWDARSGLELCPRLAQGSQVLWARFSPSGAKVVTASGDKTARVWDAKTGQPITPPLRHGAWVIDAEFSADSSKVVTVSYAGAVRVWDVGTGLPVTEPLDHRDQVNYTLFSPDGKQLATASSDHTVRVLNARSGILVTVLQHEKQVVSLDFTSDSARIVTTSFDNTARLWDAQTGQPLTAPLRHEGVVNSAQFSPDGTKVLTASADKTARIWDSRTGKQLGEPLYHAHGVGSAFFSPDGGGVLTVSDRSARVWDARNGLPVVEQLLHDDVVSSAQFSVDGSRVVTASFDSTVKIWDVLSVPIPVPTWFLDWAEARVGRRLAVSGDGGPISFAEQRRQWEQVQVRKDTNVYTRIAQWVQAEPAERTITPGAAQTTQSYVKQRINENTIGSLHEALLLSPSNSLACARQALRVPRIIAENALSIGNPPLDQTDNESVDWARRVLREQSDDDQENGLLLQEAERWTRQSLRNDANETEGWRAQGVIAWLRNRPDEALTNLDRVLALRPGDAESWELKGDILEKKSRHEEALDAYEQSLRLYPATEKVQGCQRLQVLDKHAALCRRMGLLNRAIADLRQGGVPERAAATDARMIDLSAYYNLEFGEGLLAQSLTGIRDVNGRHFDARGCLFLTSGKFFPNRVPDQMRGIPIGLSGAHVHFLHGAFFCLHEPPGTPIGKYVLHLSDGTVLDKELILGQDVLDTQADPPAPGAGKAIMACALQDSNSAEGTPMHLYQSTVELPHSETRVATLDFISYRKAAAPFLVAVTIE
jgi:WD40 repeat protein/tetratricopeptide (TPR) repeat protein